MSDTKSEESESIDSTAKKLPSRIFTKKALPLIVALGVGVVLALGGVAYADTFRNSVKKDAKEILDAGIAPLKEEQKRLATEQERIKDKQAAFEVKVDKRFDEQGADIRALYKAMMTGQKQDRLEKPLPSPDGGE